MLRAAWEAYFDGSTELAAHRLVMTSGESVRLGLTTLKRVSNVFASSHALLAKRQEGGAQDSVRFPRGIRPSKSCPYPGVSAILPLACPIGTSLTGSPTLKSATAHGTGEDDVGRLLLGVADGSARPEACLQRRDPW